MNILFIIKVDIPHFAIPSLTYRMTQQIQPELLPFPSVFYDKHGEPIASYR